MSAAAPRVGFLGLGIMGAQMASRLVGTGQNVMVYNRSVAKAEPLRQLGAAVASTPAEVTSTCDLVFAMLADPKAAKAVAMDGPDSAVAGIAARPASAQPVTFITGCPDGRLETAMSFHEMPMRRPVPSALEQASFAAQRLA